MGRTPDRVPGPTIEEELVLHDPNFTESGSVCFSSASFFYQYNNTLATHRHFQPATIDPVVSASEGDRYYNTSLEMEMRYDSIRDKWLSIEGNFFQVGRNGLTNPSEYYRGINGLVCNEVRGYPAIFSGTLIAFGYSRESSGSMVFEIMSGSNILAFASSSQAVQKFSNLNADFGDDTILNVRNSSGSVSTTNNVSIWTRVKWRA